MSAHLLQVTNPPIDPLREGLVMSLEMRLGGRGNLLQPSANTYRQVRAFDSCVAGSLWQIGRSAAAAVQHVVHRWLWF